MYETALHVSVCVYIDMTYLHVYGFQERREAYQEGRKVPHSLVIVSDKSPTSLHPLATKTLWGKHRGLCLPLVHMEKSLKASQMSKWKSLNTHAQHLPSHRFYDIESQCPKSKGYRLSAGLNRCH